MLKAILRKAVYGIVVVDELIPNLLLVLLLLIIAFLILLRLSRVDEDYIRLKVSTFSFLSTITLLGVIISSPLPVRSGDMGSVVIQGISLFCVLLALFVCSYMDMQTGTMIVGYVLLGFVMQAGLFLTELLRGMIPISSFEVGMLVACAMVLALCFAFGSQSGLDLLLFYMCFLHILITAGGSYVALCIVCFMTAFITSAIINGIFKMPGMLKEKREGKKVELRFPFTIYIYIGLMASLFFV